MSKLFQDNHTLLSLGSDGDSFVIKNGPKIQVAGRLCINQDQDGLLKANKFLNVVEQITKHCSPGTVAENEGGLWAVPHDFEPFQSNNRSFSMGRDDDQFTLEETEYGFVLYGACSISNSSYGLNKASTFLKMMQSVVSKLSTKKDLPEKVVSTGFITSSDQNPFG